MTDLEKANDLLRRFVEWEASPNNDMLASVFKDARAYLATQPEAVDPDWTKAQEIARVGGFACDGVTLEQAIEDYRAGYCVYLGIKHGRSA